MEIFSFVKIKDIFTLCNAFCGFGAIILAAQGQPELACLFIFLAAIFDFIDGAVARATTTNDFGKELDSLCDVISFGVAPAWIAYTIVNDFSVIFVFLIYLAGGILRLARFNVTKQSNFTGLPIPAAAIFVTCFTFLVVSNVVTDLIYLFLVAAMGILMISDTTYMSQKKLTSTQILRSALLSIIVYFALFNYDTKILGLIGSFGAITYIFSPLWKKKKAVVDEEAAMPIDINES